MCVLAASALAVSMQVMAESIMVEFTLAASIMVDITVDTVAASIMGVHAEALGTVVAAATITGATAAL